MIVILHLCQEVHFWNSDIFLVLELCAYLDVPCSCSHITAAKHYAISPNKIMSSLKVLTFICLLVQHTRCSITTVAKFSSGFVSKATKHYPAQSWGNMDHCFHYGLFCADTVNLFLWKIRKKKNKIHKLEPVSFTAPGLTQPGWNKAQVFTMKSDVLATWVPMHAPELG